MTAGTEKPTAAGPPLTLLLGARQRFDRGELAAVPGMTLAALQGIEQALSQIEGLPAVHSLGSAAFAQLLMAAGCALLVTALFLPAAFPAAACCLAAAGAALVARRHRAAWAQRRIHELVSAANEAPEGTFLLRARTEGSTLLPLEFRFLVQLEVRGTVSAMIVPKLTPASEQVDDGCRISPLPSVLKKAGRLSAEVPRCLPKRVTFCEEALPQTTQSI